MSGDCQSQELGEWLQALGWPEGLQPSDLRKLNTPKMRSVWRHLQAHVVPTHIASTIRKNVLLARLEKENMFVGKLNNFKLDSVNQLHKVKEILKVEEEKDKIKEEIQTTDEKLKNEKSSLLQKIVTKEWERQNLSELEEKTTILELKNLKLLKYCKRVTADIETAAHLKSAVLTSHNESNHQKSMVCKYVKNYSYPFKDSEDDSEYLCEMMVSILDYKPDSILDGISSIAKEAVRDINSKVDSSANIGVSFPSNKMVSFQTKLKHLQVLVIQKELKIHGLSEKIALELSELQKEKAEFFNAFLTKEKSRIEEDGGSNEVEKGSTVNHVKRTIEEINEGDSNESASQLLDDILVRIQEESRRNEMHKDKNQLLTEDKFESLEDLEQSVSSLGAKEDELRREVEKKVKEVNMVASAVYGNAVDSGELNELLSQISQLASDFKIEINEMSKQKITCSEFTDMILKEIEVFQITPMVALLRKWDTSNEMLQNHTTKKFSDNPSLLHFLLQTEEKNCIVNVIEKYLWSLSINPQFH